MLPPHSAGHSTVRHPALGTTRAANCALPTTLDPAPIGGRESADDLHRLTVQSDTRRRGVWRKTGAKNSKPRASARWCGTSASAGCPRTAPTHRWWTSRTARSSASGRCTTTGSTTEKDLNPWKFEVRGKTFEPSMKSLIPPFTLAYKKRVYSPNRVLYPLKRVDWDPNGERNPQNRGISKYKRISWDEALDIVVGEIKRIKEKYGMEAHPLAVRRARRDQDRPRRPRLPAQAAAPAGAASPCRPATPTAGKAGTGAASTSGAARTCRPDGAGRAT